MRRRRFQPAQHRLGRRRGVEGGIDLDRGEKARVPGEPLGSGKLARVEHFAPFFKAPGARADADFVLMSKVQTA